MKRCPHCMRPAEGELCPHCGKSLNTAANSAHLPVGCVIKNGSQAYEIGAALGQGGFGITYVGLDCTLGRRVAIKEYFPARCAGALRNTGLLPVRAPKPYTAAA